MTPAFHSIIAASEADRRGIFLTAANRLGTTIQNVEKDFWVCWTLDALFNGFPEGGPRLLFKGGTSLSKAFSLISRFSEDIDITVFRQDLGQPASIEELESLSGKKRRARLDAIREALPIPYRRTAVGESRPYCEANHAGGWYFTGKRPNRIG
ncbi:MAG: nucleotidyl transferase AbiEii/AbiGii toxin family protein [Chthoniobacterales bacterium]